MPPILTKILIDIALPALVAITRDVITRRHSSHRESTRKFKEYEA